MDFKAEICEHGKVTVPLDLKDPRTFQTMDDIYGYHINIDGVMQVLALAQVFGKPMCKACLMDAVVQLRDMAGLIEEYVKYAEGTK